MRRTLTLLAVLPLLSVGCAHSSGKGWAISHQPGAGSYTLKAPCSVTYTLHAATTAWADIRPLETVQVEAGRQVGFVHAPDGTLMAYAAGRTMPLPEGGYVWRMVPGSKRTPGNVVSDGAPDDGGKAAERLEKVATGGLRFAGQVLYAIARGGGGSR